MKNENILLEKFEYKNKELIIYYSFYFEKDKKFYENEKFKNRILKFKNVKSFSHHFSEDYLNLIDELIELKKEIGNEYFTKVFYRSKNNKKIYIFDQIEAFMIIEFNDQKEWNYREQKN